MRSVFAVGKRVSLGSEIAMSFEVGTIQTEGLDLGEF